MLSAVTSEKQRRAMIELPHPDEDFSANPVELFFDLAFVFAFSQLVGRLIHDPTLEGLGLFTLLFLMLWLPWTTMTWAANAISANSRPVQVILLIATATSVPMAASVTTAFAGGGLSFAVSLSVIIALALTMMSIGYPTGSAEFYSSLKYSVPNYIAIAFFIAGAFVEDSSRIVLWIVGLLSVIYGTIRAGRGSWLVRPGHFAERHGLILIIALGEVIVAIAIPVLAGLETSDTIPGLTIASLLASGAFAGLLWWAYFDRPQRLWEHQFKQLAYELRGRFARDVYTYTHAPIVAGVILSAAALEEITLHPGDPLPFEFRLMFLAGLGLFFGGIEIGARLVHRVFPPERALAVALLAAVLLLGETLSGLTILVVTDLVALGALLVEGLRVKRILVERQPS